MKNTPLNLPEAPLRISIKDGKEVVWDRIRQKHVRLEPEEWVRQQMIHYLVDHKEYPAGLMAVEAAIKVNGLNKRADIIIHDKQGKAKMIVELKSPDVKIDQNVFMQIAAYNLTLQVDYLLLSNGLEHYCFYLDKKKKEMVSLKAIPNYTAL